ncbi:MAG: TolB family protein, partial [Chloroflexota bacterium]
FPAWSPAGREIAFTRAPATVYDGGANGAERHVSQRTIWLMAPDGSAKRQLTKGDGLRDEHPEWSADGTWLLFARFQGKEPELWLIRADGSSPTRVVTGLPSGPDDRNYYGYYGYVDWPSLYDWWSSSDTCVTSER